MVDFVKDAIFGFRELSGGDGVVSGVVNVESVPVEVGEMTCCDVEAMDVVDG